MFFVQVNNKNKPAMPIPGWVKLTFMGLKCDNYQIPFVSRGLSFF